MMKFYDILLTLLRPFIKIMGHIGLPKRKFTGEDYYKIRDLVTIGDVLLVNTFYELSNVFNPCELKHGAIYVGRIFGDEVCYVFESTGQGAILTDLVTFLTRKDVVVCVRHKALLKADMSVIQNVVLKLKGTPYDYMFNPDGQAFYCFELVVKVLRTIWPHLNLKPREVLKSKKIFDHETFLDPEMFSVVFDTRKVKA